MNRFHERFVVFLLVVLLLPVSCLAGKAQENFFNYAAVISFLNVALEITSAICLIQYFFRGERNHTGFQAFNLIYGVVFYFVALSFLVNHKTYYEGLGSKSASQCITWFFFGNGIYSVLQWMVIVAMALNIVYIKKYHDS